MNFKAIAHKIICLIDEHSGKGLEVLLRLFPLFCVHYAAHEKFDIVEFKKDLSWLLWVILQKHKTARSNSKIIEILLFLGADPEFKLLPSLPSSKQMIAGNQDSLGNIFDVLSKQQLSVDICQYKVQWPKTREHPEIDFNTKTEHHLIVNKQNEQFTISYSSDKCLHFALLNLLSLGYSSAAEKLLQKYPSLQSGSKIDYIVTALRPMQVNIAFIEDENNRVNNLKLISNYLMPTTELEVGQLYRVVNGFCADDKTKIGISINSMLFLVVKKSLELFKVFFNGKFALDLRPVEKRNRTLNLPAILSNIVMKITDMPEPVDYTLVAMNYMQTQHEQHFSRIVTYFWEYLTRRVVEGKQDDLLKVSTIIPRLIQASFYTQSDLFILLATALKYNRPSIIEVILKSLSDEQFFEIFKLDRFISFIDDNKLHEQVVTAIFTRFQAIINKPESELHLQTRSTAVALLGYIAIFTNSPQLYERALAEGLDPYTDLKEQAIPSAIGLIICKKNYHLLEVTLKYKRFNISAKLDRSLIPYQSKVLDLLPKPTSPITIESYFRYQQNDDLVSKPVYREDLKSTYYAMLRGSKPEIEARDLMDDSTWTLPTLIGPQLIDSHFGKMNLEERRQWLQEHKEKVIAALDLENPVNYSRLLGCFISVRRHDLLQLFLELQLNLDCNGIQASLLVNGEMQLINIRALEFAVYEGDIQSITLLKEAGSELFFHPNDEIPPLALAMKIRNSQVSNYIISSLIVSEQNRTNISKFMTAFCNHLHINIDKSKFLEMFKRCGLRDIYTSAAPGIKFNDSEYLKQLAQYYNDATFLELTGGIFQVLFLACIFDDQEHTLLIIDFLVLLLISNSSKHNMYLVMGRVVNHLKDKKNYDEIEKEVVVDRVLAAVLEKMSHYSATAACMEDGLLELLLCLNTSRFIHLADLFLPNTESVRSPILFGNMAATAIKAKLYSLAIKLLGYPIALLDNYEGMPLIWYAAEQNSENVVSKIIQSATDSKINLTDSIFMQSVNNQCCLHKAIENQNHHVLSLLCTYLLSTNADLSKYLVQLYGLVSYARDIGKVLAGEMIGELIAKRTLVGDRNPKTPTTNDSVRESNNGSYFFAFTRPDKNTPARISISEHEYEKLSETSKKKLENIFKESGHGRTGTIRQISKYAQFSIMYKIRFHDIDSSDRRGYLKLKTDSPKDNPEFEFFTAPKHR